MDECEKTLEEWKITRATIIEFDHILSNIRSLDVTATMILFGAGFQYSHDLFIIALMINIAFLLLEIHYHKYLYATAEHARILEDKIGFKLTNKLQLSRNEYKKHKLLKYVSGFMVANIYYIIYFGFIVLSIILFCLQTTLFQNPVIPTIMGQNGTVPLQV